MQIGLGMGQEPSEYIVVELTRRPREGDILGPFSLNQIVWGTQTAIQMMSGKRVRVLKIPISGLTYVRKGTTGSNIPVYPTQLVR